MESLGDSNCQSMSDSFSLYERYMRSFNIVDKENNDTPNLSDRSSSSNLESRSHNTRANIELATAQSTNLLSEHCNIPEADTICNLQIPRDNITDKCYSSDIECNKVDSCTSAASLLESSNATIDHSLLTEKSNQTDVHVSSEETRRDFKQPVFITSTMENSNNAVDSVPMFRDVRHAETVFKLPIRELSFNGTIKHVQKMKPIVDPITALSSNKLALADKSESNTTNEDESSIEKSNDAYEEPSNDANKIEKSDSTGDSQYEECNGRKDVVNDDTMKWNLDQSHSSFEASFDSGVRSPDMFSDGDDDMDPVVEQEPFWSFLKDFESYDKRKVRKIEETLHSILPPPSVTMLKIDVTEMLKKYYSFLPVFTDNKLDISEEVNSTTPTKRVSFVQIPDTEDREPLKCSSRNESRERLNNSDLDTSGNDKSVELKSCTETEAVETSWPDVLKCRYHDIYYNVTKYSEKYELLSLRYGERYVGAETDTSVNIHSGGFQSPSSASKRKALRLKMAQAKSPGRRLSHLARRRQAFFSAATINEKAQSSTSKMVLIDKKKLINSAERKSPRLKRTPGKKTPNRKTPGKKTPAKTPKTRSGGSSKKKAMRRLLMDSDSLTRSQPSRESLKRALFISPENRKAVPLQTCLSLPAHAMRTKRALFGSPVRPADTKSSDGTQSDQFLKRKRDALDDIPESSKSKIAKSLSFGGDTIGNPQSISFSRRASEVFAAKKSTEMNNVHKQKLLWAVSEALRIHGWRMSSPGFREKASNLAQLTRRLMILPSYAAKLNAPTLSTSDTLLKIAKQYVFAIIQGRSVEECYQEEQIRQANEANSKVSGYISAQNYQQIKSRQNTSTSSQIKENCSMTVKQELSKSGNKNVLQDKMVNIDTSSNSSSGFSMFDKSVPLFKSNSMPTFEEAAKMRARRQISFDNVDFPKRYLGGTSPTYVALGLHFARGESTIAAIVADTTKKIWDTLKNRCMPVPDTNKWKQIAERYYILWNMPNCLGSIDGKHFKIKKYPNRGSSDFNYKHYNSVILMACADADGLFTMIEVGYAGRNSDAGIFGVSAMKRLIEEEALNIPAPVPLPLDENNYSFPFYFVGDEAFPLKNYLMRPFPGRTATNTSRIFNYRLSRARKSVECAFGMLTEKFMLFESPIRCRTPGVVNNIIKSACVLHNFVRSKEGIPYKSTIIGEGSHQRPTDLIPHNVALGPNPSPLSLRKYLNNYFLTPQAALPWQWAYCV